MSYVLHEPSGAPWMLFSGDALFAGDVGRVDFLGESRLEEMAGLLHRTLFERLLPLGDGVILCPAHGAGSACGTSIASRVWTTIGLERRLNPKLQLTDRASFVAQVGKSLDKAPYFQRMESMNLSGTVWPCEPVAVPSLAPPEFADRARGAVVLDTRCPSCFGAAHVPGAVCMPLEEIPSYAGWFLPYDRPILLVTEGGDAGRAARYLYRIGFDRVAGSLQGCIKAWHSAGLSSSSAGIIDPLDFADLLDDGSPWVLDVRSAGELAAMPPVGGARHIHIHDVAGRTREVPRDRPVYVVCATGTRAAIVSSLLLRDGVVDVTVVLGGMAGLARARQRALGV
jgi:hydroxyacylglutathione hydrolase